MSTIRDIVSKSIATLRKSENFSGDKSDATEDIIVPTLAHLVVLCVTLFVFLLIGKWIWNNHIVAMITVAKPIDSVIPLLGAAFLSKVILI